MPLLRLDTRFLRRARASSRAPLLTHRGAFPAWITLYTFLIPSIPPRRVSAWQNGLYEVSTVLEQMDTLIKEYEKDGPVIKAEARAAPAPGSLASQP